MKYLCLIYVEENSVEAMPQTRHDAIVEECRAFDADLRAKGRLIASERLQPVSTATTLKHANGQVSITDGPFAETKEQLGGFYLIEADNLDDALGIAREIPPGRLGTIEVRPIWEYP